MFELLRTQNSPRAVYAKPLQSFQGDLHATPISFSLCKLFISLPPVDSWQRFSPPSSLSCFAIHHYTLSLVSSLTWTLILVLSSLFILSSTSTPPKILSSRLFSHATARHYDNGNNNKAQCLQRPPSHQNTRIRSI